MWRNWYTRQIQDLVVHFRIGSSPIMGTNFKKLDNMKKIDHYTVRQGYEMCYFGSTEYNRVNNQMPTYYPPKK